MLSLPVLAAAAASSCLAPGPLPAAAPPAPLRFGLTPQLAGSAGAAQLPALPEDAARTDAALQGLRVPDRDLVVRLNRMFWADGADGIARYAALVDRYAAAGLKTELQVRYHPPEGREGDIEAWLAYVREAVATFAAKPSVVELSITNEGNLPVSPNTSDGVYDGVVEALVRGVEVARAELDRRGRPDVTLGFTYAYRFTPDADEAFFDAIGRAATPAFEAALDHVGLQVYPGLFFPPVTTDAPQDVVDAANLLRTCLMPRAGLGDDVDLWVTETGYATRGGAGEAQQAADLAGTLDALHAVSGTLGVTDVRYFNLRDNRSAGTDLFDAVGLLFDDYRAKPAAATFRDAIARHGAPPQRLRLIVRRRRRHRVRVRVVPPVRARVTLGRRAVTAGARGRAVLRVRRARTLRATFPGYRPGRVRLRVRSGP